MNSDYCYYLDDAGNVMGIAMIAMKVMVVIVIVKYFECCI